MLKSLHIDNMAVVKRADVEPGEGFTVLTGETGAGKSLIIDSVNLLLGLSGGRSWRELIRTGEDSMLVSAQFGNLSEYTLGALGELGLEPDEDGLLYLQRKISSDGKSTVRVNGRSLPISILRDAGKFLIDIHGQHDNQELLDPSRHIELLDEYAGLESELAEYSKRRDELIGIKRERDDIIKSEREKARTVELLKYQIADIDSGKLKKNEEKALLEKRKRVADSEKIRRQSRIIYRALYRSEKSPSAYELLDAACSALEALDGALPDALVYSEKLRSYMYELEDIAECAKSAGEEDFDDPTAELNRIEARLDVIDKLEKKYGETVDEVLAFRDKAAGSLSELELSDVRLKELDAKLKTAEAAAEKAASALTKKRSEAAETLEKRITEELSFLDMAKVRFSVSIKRTTGPNGEPVYSKLGADEVEFLIATNAGEVLKPLSKIASGGELSRIMLAMKNVFAGKSQVGTVIFDEIDTGVSGRTSQKIGIKLASIAGNGTQVICVTHSAQIAATAGTHLLISKREKDGRVETTVEELDRDGRIGEISRIMGGLTITDTIRRSAAELLDQNNINSDK